MPAAAQSTTTGTLKGTVTDPSGAILPGAVVTAVSDALVPRELIAIANAQEPLAIQPPRQIRLGVRLSI